MIFSDYKIYHYFVRNKAKTFNFINFKVQNKIITNVKSVYRMNRPSPFMVNVVENVVYTEHHYTFSFECEVVTKDSIIVWGLSISDQS